ncbi:MAG TPA: Do family serine endopeptidase [Bryobacteraceae bacterium]|nr:Do family serine endopeptidase [Bryobacteraceae bacterium]
MKRNFALVAVAAASFGGAVSWHYATEHTTAPVQVHAQTGAPGLTFAPMVRKVTPAVVNISSTRVVRTTSNRNRPGARRQPQTPEEFFGDLFGRGGGGFPGMPDQQPRRQGGVGSGVIVTSDGYILTNNHVVDEADQVTVSLSDRREFTAKVIGGDPNTDIAVLKIEGKNLPTVPIRTDLRPAVGDLALAIGNPFGIGQTVTMGIVSATGRAGLNIEQYEDFIQTDAAINPGNSGGALVNTSGELIGINTAILAGGGGGNQGIGFAIPVAMAREVMDQLVKTGKVVRGYMGAQVQDVTPALARAFKLPTAAGAALPGIEPGSPAEKAGLQPGDVVTAVNGEPVADANALRLRISRTAPGTAVRLTVQRQEGPREITVTLGTLPTQDRDNDGAPDLQGGTRTPLEGVSVEELDRETAQQLRLPPTVRGVVVTDVDAASAAYDAGLRRGDVIQSVNRKPITSVREFETAVGRGQSVLLLVNRGGRTLFLAVEPAAARQP